MKLKEFLEEYSDVEITEEQKEQIKKYLNIKENKNWKPKTGEENFYVDCWGDVMETVFAENDKTDMYRLFTDNCFKTKEEAEFRLEQIKVYYELKNFADENNDKINWDDGSIKYHIYIDKTYNCIHVDQAAFTQSIGQIYFSSREIAQQAIEKVGADRIRMYLFGVKEDE